METNQEVFCESECERKQGLKFRQEQIRQEGLVLNYIQIIIQGMYYSGKEWTMKASGLQFTS